MQDTREKGTGSAGIGDRFRNWSGFLNCGFTGMSCRVYVDGEYRLGGRCGGKRLERRIAGDFNPALFTIHVVDAAGEGGDWISLSGSFQASSTVHEVILDDGEQQHNFQIDRSMVGDNPDDGDGAGAALTQSGTSDGGEEKESIPCPFADSGDWEAWVDTMPGAPRNMIVIGKVEVGSDGYEGRLTAGPVGKSNPPVQYFELTLVESQNGKAGWQDVRGETAATYDEYAAVIIDCHGDMLARIPVRIVS